jgi:hypothetical protein
MFYNYSFIPTCKCFTTTGYLISDVWNIFAQTVGRDEFDTIHIGNIIPYAMEYGSNSSLWTNDKERKAIQKLQYNCLKVLCHGHVDHKFKVLGCFGQDAKDWWVVWCL